MSYRVVWFKRDLRVHDHWPLLEAARRGLPQPAATGLLTMKMRKKSDLPRKICVACGLPFVWRRKWARDWDQVKYCSDRCRQAGPRQGPAA